LDGSLAVSDEKCQKVKFDEIGARMAIVDAVLKANRGNRKRRECRCYRCPKCGAWHLTSRGRR
jgi:hypothetical protein